MTRLLTFVALCVGCLLFAGCGEGPTGPVAVTGNINAAAVGKWAPHAQSVNQAYSVVAQSDQTGELYRGTTDAEGNFQIDIPVDEAGSSFVFSVLDPNGRAMGPIVIETVEDEGVTGVALNGEAESLGDIVLPADPTQAPLQPGSGSTVEGQADDELFTRLNDDGVPVGVPNVGKGADSLLGGAAGGDGLDSDQDGLIDMVDADDDGDGIVDDFDPDSGQPESHALYCFMNLKISPEEGPTYYTGTAAQVDTRLKTDTAISFGVAAEAFPGQTITEVRCLTSPAPAYLPLCKKVSDGPSGLTYALWSDTGYAFDQSETGWDVFVQPNEVMNAGDLFTVEITFDDGSTTQLSQMVNFVFKNIPNLVEYGHAGNMNTFDINGPTDNGTWDHPVRFDGTQDLVLVFEPPVDENGNIIAQLDYAFEVFYQKVSGEVIEVDGAATWTTPIANWTPERYDVAAADLVLVGGQYTVTLPKEIFADTVVDTNGSNQAVGFYKIDIAPQRNGNNSAIMLAFEKL